jgi:hypothetical protein
VSTTQILERIVHRLAEHAEAQADELDEQVGSGRGASTLRGNPLTHRRSPGAAQPTSRVSWTPGGNPSSATPTP